MGKIGLRLAEGYRVSEATVGYAWGCDEME